MDIREHTNADRLEMATLNGKDYEFVVVKGQFPVGDVVVYFPVDAILPAWVTDALGLTGKLAGKENNRVKTIKLRGNISQGIVAPPQAFAERQPAIRDAVPGDDVTDLLGVEKYEPPIVPSQYGDLLPLPDFVSKYDIESAQNHVSVAQVLMDGSVFITEKLEGSHWSVSWLSENGEVFVSQRNFRIEPNDRGEHDWHKVARTGHFGEKLAAIAAEWQGQTETKVQAVTVRGEMVGPGIQGNYYKLKDHAVYVFEIEINGTPLMAKDFPRMTEAHEIPLVSVLAVDVKLRDWLGEKSIKKASDGQSRLAPVRREGVVIKPMTERRDDALGRVVIKQRSAEYLSKSEF